MAGLPKLPGFTFKDPTVSYDSNIFIYSMLKMVILAETKF